FFSSFSWLLVFFVAITCFPVRSGSAGRRRLARPPTASSGRSPARRPADVHEVHGRRLLRFRDAKGEGHAAAADGNSDRGAVGGGGRRAGGGAGLPPGPALREAARGAGRLEAVHPRGAHLPAPPAAALSARPARAAALPVHAPPAASLPA